MKIILSEDEVGRIVRRHIVEKLKDIFLEGKAKEMVRISVVMTYESRNFCEIDIPSAMQALENKILELNNQDE
jgi:hypothetical protein